jgi:hypothetical protein
MWPSEPGVGLMPSGVMAEEGPRHSCQPREA